MAKSEVRSEPPDYTDVVEFLKRVEDPKRATMNRRERISPQKGTALRRQFPGIPEEYVAYLRAIGAGAFRECQFAVYGFLGTPDEILGSGTFDWLSPRIEVLCFGDNFSGDLSGFLPQKKWAVVELWHDSGTLYRVKKSFGEYIRKRMLMGPGGKDLRGRA